MLLFQTCKVASTPKSIEEILKNTDLKGLLKLAEVNKNFSDLAVAAFKRNYATQRIRIGLGDLRNIDRFVYETDVILKTLKLFGSGISSMNLYCNGLLDDRYSSVVNRLVNNCSCTALTDFGMYDCAGNVWQDMTQPFKSVHTFTYAIRSGDMGNDFKPFNELFPNLQALALQNFMARDGSHADCTFPFLKRLAMQRRNQFPEFGSSFEKVVRKNLQIQDFAAINLTPSFLKFVSQHLLSVENLQITMLSTGTEIIEFPNVKRFIGAHFAAEKLQLPKLQDLRIQFNALNRDSCIKFIQNHPNISRFYLTSGSELDNQAFADITSNLVNVIVMFIDDASRITPQNIAKFMENNVKIQNLFLSYCVASAKNSLAERLKDKWIIIEYRNCLSFRRKTY